MIAVTWNWVPGGRPAGTWNVRKGPPVPLYWKTGAPMGVAFGTCTLPCEPLAAGTTVSACAVLPTPATVTHGSRARAAGGEAEDPGFEIDVTGTDTCAYTTACFPESTTRVGTASTRCSAGCAGSLARSA